MFLFGRKLKKMDKKIYITFMERAKTQGSAHQVTWVGGLPFCSTWPRVIYYSVSDVNSKFCGLCKKHETCYPPLLNREREFGNIVSDWRAVRVK
jgi:hypothetical protein